MAVLQRNIVTQHGASGLGSPNNDAPAFADFQTWALANQGSDSIVLTVPTGATCWFGTNVGHWVSGIKDLTISGAGATLTNVGGSNLFLGADGVVQDNAHSARVATCYARVSSSVQLLDVSKASLFTVGTWALLTGFDLQGAWQGPFGYPNNPHYFEYVYITAINGDVISFLDPLTYTYRSTWPNYNSGSSHEVDNAGPGTLYAISAAWDTRLEFQGLTITKGDSQTVTNGRDITYRNVTFTGQGGGVPSQNKIWRAYDSIFTNCTMEVDKLISEILIDNITIFHINFQSSSIGTFTARNSTVTDRIDGTPKRTIIENCSIPDFRPGAYAYGRSDYVSCSDSVISAFTPLGLTESGIGSHNASSTYSMDDSGVISFANGSLISGFADNGSGAIRLTVNSTSGFVTGKYMQVTGVVGASSASSNWIVTVIDGTHVDLVGSAIGSAYDSYSLIRGPSAPRWAVPGTKIYFSGVQDTEFGCTVLDVTQDAASTYIRTDWPYASALTLLPATAGAINFRTCPSPIMNFRNCTGGVATVNDLCLDGAQGKPVYSYTKRTYGGASIVSPVGPTIWGKIVQVKISVNQAYTGAQGTLTCTAFQSSKVRGIDPNFSISNWLCRVNLKVAGTRIVTATGVTGAQSGDTLTAPGALWFGGLNAPTCSTNVSAEVAGNPALDFSVEIEVTTDQGIIPQFVSPLQLHLHA